MTLEMAGGWDVQAGGSGLLKKRAALLLAFFLTACTMPATDSNDTPAYARANDCAVIGAIARGQWKGAGPGAPMDAKSFGVDCNWKALGLPRPAITRPEDQPPISFSYAQPVYRADGLQATVDWSYGGSQNAQGHPERYFYTGSQCMAEKRHGKWQFIACRMKYVT